MVVFMKRQVDRHGLDQFLGGFRQSGEAKWCSVGSLPSPSSWTFPRSFIVASDPALSGDENRTC
jgi:hypothetical protein